MSIDPCERCEELLQDFLDRTLTNEEWAEAEQHLVGCDYCRQRIHVGAIDEPAGRQANQDARPGTYGRG